MAVLCVTMLINHAVFFFFFWGSFFSNTGKNSCFQPRIIIQAENQQQAFLIREHYLVRLMKYWPKYEPLHCRTKNKDAFE